MSRLSTSSKERIRIAGLGRYPEPDPILEMGHPVQALLGAHTAVDFSAFPRSTKFPQVLLLYTISQIVATTNIDLRTSFIWLRHTWKFLHT